MPKTPLKQQAENLFASEPPQRIRQKLSGEAAGTKMAKEMREILLSKIRVDASQVRRGNKGPESPGTKQLAESIKEDGLIQPLTVAYNVADDVYDLIAGERRYHACRLAGKISVLCHVKEDLAEDDKKRLQLIENIQREDLPAVDVALALLPLIEGGHTATDIQRYTKKGKSWVSKFLRIAKSLNANDLAVIEQSPAVYTSNTLYDVARLDPEQRGAALTHLAGHLLNEKDARAYVADLAAKPARAGRPKGSYTKTIKQDGVTVSIKFAKKHASRAEVIDQLEQALGKLKKSA